MDTGNHILSLVLEILTSLMDTTMHENAIALGSSTSPYLMNVGQHCLK